MRKSQRRSSSLADAMPTLALLECMGHGIPAVVSRVPGADWVTRHGVNGFLHERGDVEEIQEQLSLPRSHADLCARMGDEARRTVENDFSWGAVARKIVSKYENVMEESLSTLSKLRVDFRLTSRVSIRVREGVRKRAILVLVKTGFMLNARGRFSRTVIP